MNQVKIFGKASEYSQGSEWADQGNGWHIYSTTIHHIGYMIIADKDGWEIQVTDCHGEPIRIVHVLKSGNGIRIRDSKRRSLLALKKLST